MTRPRSDDIPSSACCFLTSCQCPKANHWLIQAPLSVRTRFVLSTADWSVVRAAKILLTCIRQCSRAGICRPTKANRAPSSSRKSVTCCTSALSISCSCASSPNPRKSKRCGSFSDSMAKSDCGEGRLCPKLVTALPVRSSKPVRCGYSTHCAVKSPSSQGTQCAHLARTSRCSPKGE